MLRLRQKAFDVLLPQATSNAFLFRAHVCRRENHRLMYLSLLMRTNVQGPNHKHSRSVRWANKKRHTSPICFQFGLWFQGVCPVAATKNKMDRRRSRSLPEEFPFLCSKARTTNLQIVMFSIYLITWSTQTATCERHLLPSFSNCPHKPCKSCHCGPLCFSTYFSRNGCSLAKPNHLHCVTTHQHRAKENERDERRDHTTEIGSCTKSTSA